MDMVLPLFYIFAKIPRWREFASFGVSLSNDCNLMMLFEKFSMSTCT